MRPACQLAPFEPKGLRKTTPFLNQTQLLKSGIICANQGRKRRFQFLPSYRTLRDASVLPAALAAGFLSLAVSSRWPYSFYVLMRLTVCAIGLYLAHKSFIDGRKAWAWILGCVAVLFNPLVPMRMHRSDWSTIDIIAASIFVLWALMSVLQHRKRT
jgi:hypothetical protein